MTRRKSKKKNRKMKSKVTFKFKIFLVNYKTSRKARFFIRKLFGYLFWAATLWTLYNLYLYKKNDKPEKDAGYNKYLFKLVGKIHYFFKLIYGVNKNINFLDINSSLLS